MSHYRDFCDTPATGRHILWTVRCASDPVPLSDLYTEEFLDTRVRREVQFFINAGDLIPLAIDDELHLSYNPIMDWMYGVYHLFQYGDREAIEAKERDAQAEISMYQDLYDADTSDAYAAAQDDISYSDYVGWYTAEQKRNWAADALNLYDTLNRVILGSAATDSRSIPAADAERHIVQIDAAESR